jgi:hypothetical protein
VNNPLLSRMETEAQRRRRERLAKKHAQKVAHASAALLLVDAPPPQPVQLYQVRVCHYKRKECGLCGLPKSNRAHTPKKTASCPFQRQNGCANCGGTMKDPRHFGAPESFNVLASGAGSGNAMVYATLKANWQRVLRLLLVASGLPRGLSKVLVEGEVTFPDHREDRDQGNFRVIIEKALGDVLEEGGWLASDNWDRYEFGQLTKVEEPGVSALRLMIFPVAAQQQPGDQMEMT